MIVQRYPEPSIAPMRAELSRLGFEDLKTPDAVDAAVKQPGTTMIVVNSGCGCAAAKARPRGPRSRGRQAPARHRAGARQGQAARSSDDRVCRSGRGSHADRARSLRAL